MVDYRDPVTGEKKGALISMDAQFDSPGYCATNAAIGVYCLRQSE